MTDQERTYVNKEEVAAELRSHPGQWALVYEASGHKTGQDWKRRPGFEVASELLPDQGNINPGQKKYKIWIRWVGENGAEGVPTVPVVAPDAEPRPVNPTVPVPSPPGPLVATPPPMAPDNRSAFQRTWDEGQGQPPM